MSLPSLGTSAAVDFVIDTGADYTIIHPADALLLVPLGITLPHDKGLGGIGLTPSRYASLPCRLTLTHTDGLSVLVVLPSVYLAQPGFANGVAPSLLGRDVLSGFRLVVDGNTGEVSLS